MTSANNGGRPARRAVSRWTLRLLRREWRQQVLVLSLLVLVVAASVLFTAGSTNAASAGDDATFGTARHRFDAELPEARDLPRLVEAAAAQYGTVEVIARWTRPIAGLADDVELRAADPAGPFGAPRLALRDGRYPTTTGEVGLTDDLAAVLGAGLGDRVDLDGRDREVVGIVENPNDLASDFALAAPTDRNRAEAVTVLFDGRAGAPARTLEVDGVELSDVSITTRADGAGAAIAAAVLGSTAVALLLVSLVAAAGFLALAQRRLRQLGVLASVGATEAHLRRIVVVHGFALGAVASALGALVGLAAWAAVSVGLEEAAGHRIDPTELPWPIVVAPVGLAVVATTMAAWWPARVVARIPVVRALSGRPPDPRPIHRSTAAAFGCLAVGVLALSRAGSNAVLVGAGTVATVGGVLLVSPLALRLVGRAAARLPVAVRLATRDLARHQARAGTALAALSLALGIPAAIVVTSTAAEAGESLVNLPDGSLVVWTRDPSQPQGVSPYYTEDPDDEGFSPYLPRLDDDELDELAAEAQRIAEVVGGTATPLELVTDRRGDITPDGRLAVTLALPAETGSFDVAPIFVASDRLLADHGLAADDLHGGPDLLSVGDLDRRLPAAVRQQLTSDELLLSNTAGRPERAGAVRTLEPGPTSLPGSMVTPAGAELRGWDPVVVGWLIDAAGAVTPEQIGEARQIALDAGVLIEPPERRASLQAVRWQATGIGLLVALGVLAATVGLLRREGEPDLRTLTATGATSTIRRTLSASTGAALSLLGGLLGTAGAYAVLAAGHLDDPGRLLPVPVAHLAMLVLGTPALAVAASWLVAGRPPAGLARPVLD